MSKEYKHGSEAKRLEVFRCEKYLKHTNQRWHMECIYASKESKYKDFYWVSSIGCYSHSLFPL